MESDGFHHSLIPRCPLFFKSAPGYTPGMAEQWNRNGYNITVKLGHLAIKAQGLVLAQRLQSIQRMMHTHTRTLLKLPGGKRKLTEVQTQLDTIKQIIKDGANRG